MYVSQLNICLVRIVLVLQSFNLKINGGNVNIVSKNTPNIKESRQKLLDKQCVDL